MYVCQNWLSDDFVKLSDDFAELSDDFAEWVAVVDHGSLYWGLSQVVVSVCLNGAH